MKPNRRPNRRHVMLSIGVALTLISASTASWAQYPAKPIRVIVPFAAGSSSDAAFRIIQPIVSELIQTPIVVENKPGAAGNIGAAAVANAPPDGYTFLYTVNSILCANPHLYTNLRFDPLKSFEAVAMIGKLGYVLLARPDAPYKSVPEFLAYAKANPGKINYSSGGAGSGNHIVMEMLERSAGVKLMHIPTKENPLAELMGSQMDVTFNPYGSGIAAAQGGRVIPLGVSMAERTPALPNVPAIGEFVKGFVGDGWHAVFAPAGTPKPIIELMNAKINEALLRPEVKKKLEGLGIVVSPGTPQALSVVLANDYERWGKFIRDANIKIN